MLIIRGGHWKNLIKLITWLKCLIIWLITNNMGKLNMTRNLLCAAQFIAFSNLINLQKSNKNNYPKFVYNTIITLEFFLQFYIL